jgi:hypothetical protein
VRALESHRSPDIYVLGAPGVTSDTLVKQLSHYGTAKRVGADDPGCGCVTMTAS